MELNTVLTKEVMRENSRTLKRIPKVLLRQKVRQLLNFTLMLHFQLREVHILEQLVFAALTAQVPTLYYSEQLVLAVLLPLHIISYKLLHRPVFHFPPTRQPTVKIHLLVEESLVISCHLHPHRFTIHTFFVNKTIQVFRHKHFLPSVRCINRFTEQLSAQLHALRWLGPITRMSGKFKVSRVNSGNNETIKIN